MDRAQVHFELFVRRHRRAPWTLALATEDRRAAFAAADDALGEPAAAIRLTKETRDPSTGELRPLLLAERGVAAEPRWRTRTRTARLPQAAPVRRPSCLQPGDLHADAGRRAIGRHLGGWLARNRVTPFELLHRADLAERLEACQADLAAALSNAALEQAGADGADLDAIRRGLEALARRAFDRVRLGDASPGFQLGRAVAERLGRCDGWAEKTALLLDLLDAAPGDSPGERAAARLLRQPLTDILGAQGDLGELFGPSLDPGDQLVILLQIALAPDVVAEAMRTPALARMAHPLSGLAARLATVLPARPALMRTKLAIARRVVTAVAGEAMLWPTDPGLEIEGLRALDALMSRAGRLVDPDAVTDALAIRWRRVARTDILDARLSECAGPMDQAQLLLDLIDEAAGRTPVLFLGRRLAALLATPVFARDLNACWDEAERPRRLAAIAARAGKLAPDLRGEIQRRLRRLAGGRQ